MRALSFSSLKKSDKNVFLLACLIYFLLFPKKDIMYCNAALNKAQLNSRRIADLLSLLLQL